MSSFKKLWPETDSCDSLLQGDFITMLCCPSERCAGYDHDWSVSHLPNNPGTVFISLFHKGGHVVCFTFVRASRKIVKTKWTERTPRKLSVQDISNLQNAFAAALEAVN
jgi:hypothetical protein